MNNDMDELFKSAAENYPLNTNSADWDKVMQQLHPAGEEVPVAPEKKDRTKYLWLLLLLPFVFICNRYTGSDNVSLNNKKNTPQQKVTGKEVYDKEGNSNTAYKKPAHPENTISGEKSQADLAQKNNQQKGIAYYSNSIALKHTTGKAYTKKKGSININRMDEQKGDITGNINNGTEANNKLNNAPESSANTLNALPDIALNNNQKPTSNSVADSTKATAIASTNMAKDSSKAEAVKVIAKNKSTKKGFYAGITFGPDYSTIKFQQIKKSGYSVGILAGYQFNNHWAVETGGLWDKKNYYSEGEYFNTKKVNIPYNIKIINVTGSCYMIEIPLNVKYTITNGVKGNWFVMAGSSSYLMKKEDYTYLYDHNNSTYDVYKAYKNSSRNWFSILNISAGYERTLNNIVTFRIEPYIKLPMSGVGIGSLPITSTGIYISITRPVLK